MQACISASKAASSDAFVSMRSMAAPPAKVSRLIAEASQTAPPKLLHAAKKYMITLSQHASGHAWTCNLNTCMGDITSGIHKPKSNSTKHSKNTTPNWAFFCGCLRFFAPVSRFFAPVSRDHPVPFSMVSSTESYEFCNMNPLKLNVHHPRTSRLYWSTSSGSGQVSRSWPRNCCMVLTQLSGMHVLGWLYI